MKPVLTTHPNINICHPLLYPSFLFPFILTIMLIQSFRAPASVGTFFLLANRALAARDGLCPPLGPVMPAPVDPSSHDPVQDAIRLVTDRFQNLTEGYNTTGISVAVKSIHESGPMLELHYTPPVLDDDSTTTVDSETIYRIGSLSKLFAVLSTLTQGQIKMEDPITKYVPELLQLKKEAVPVPNDITAVHWDQVTVGSLTSHMSGIGADRMHPHLPRSNQTNTEQLSTTWPAFPQTSLKSAFHHLQTLPRLVVPVSSVSQPAPARNSSETLEKGILCIRRGRTPCTLT